MPLKKARNSILWVNAFSCVFKKHFLPFFPWQTLVTHLHVVVPDVHLHLVLLRPQQPREATGIQLGGGTALQR